MSWFRSLSPGWRFTTALLVLAIALVSTGSKSSDAKPDRATWRDYGGGPDNARYMTLDQITKGNVGRLDVAWTYPTRDSFAYVFNPLIIDTVMYVLARNSALVALDATTGK